MLFPTFSERIASLTGETENTGEMFIAISIIQLISFLSISRYIQLKKVKLLKIKL